MGTYDRQVAQAYRKIRQKGAPVEMVYRQAVPNPSQPWEPDTSIEATTPTYAVIEEYEDSLVNGTLIQRGDRRAIVPALGLPRRPDTAGSLRVSGQLWKILNAAPLSPGGQDILYTLQLRL